MTFRVLKHIKHT